MEAIKIFVLTVNDSLTQCRLNKYTNLTLRIEHKHPKSDLVFEFEKGN